MVFEICLCWARHERAPCGQGANHPANPTQERRLGVAPAKSKAARPTECALHQHTLRCAAIRQRAHDIGGGAS